jgi:AcrR family transcriptional regulator
MPCYRLHQVIDEDVETGGRRGELVAAAFARLATGGFERLRTRDVAADVGVNIATLHYYFPTKEALIRSVIGYAMRRFMTTMPREGSPATQLRGHLRAVAALLTTEPELWTVMGELVLRAPRDAELGEVLRRADGYWHQTLGALIVRAVEAGELQPLLEPSATARLIIAAIRGVSLPGGDPTIAPDLFTQFEALLGFAAGGEGVEG